MIAASASAKKTNPTHWITPNGLPTFLTQINWMRFSEGTGVNCPKTVGELHSRHIRQNGTSDHSERQI